MNKKRSRIHTPVAVVAVVLLAMLTWPLEAMDLCGDTGTPIAISFDQRGFLFTSIDNGVWFDLDADGDTDRIAWLSASFDLAWLALGRLLWSSSRRAGGTGLAISSGGPPWSISKNLEGWPRRT